MKTRFIIRIIFFSFTLYQASVSAQNDTIFYDKNWKATTKLHAEFYRPLPLLQKGENSLIKDYYLDGTLQFKGWSKTTDLDGYYIGEVVWYYPNGEKKHLVNYEKGKVNGSEISYSENGILQQERQILNGEIITSKTYNAKGKLLNSMTFKNGYRYEGVSSCFLVYKKGKRVGKTLYYKNTTTKAYTSTCSENGCDEWKEEIFYNKKGEILQKNKIIENDLVDGKKITFFKAKKCGYVETIQSITSYKNGIANGAYIRYGINEEILCEGTYKDNVPFEGKFDKIAENLLFISDYKNGKKNGKETVFNEGKKIAEGTYLIGEKQNGFFVEEKKCLGNKKTPTITHFINGLEEGKQEYYSVKTDKVFGYYHAKNGKKEGTRVIFDKEGNITLESTYKNGLPHEGTFIKNGVPYTYKDGKKIRDNVHIDLIEKEKMDAFSKGSDKIEGGYNMGGFEMAGAIYFLDTYQFFYSLSVGSLDLVTYGAYHLKNGKLKLKIPEEQKQAFIIYGNNTPAIKDSIQVAYYNYNARTKPLLQINKQWYSLDKLKSQQDRSSVNRFRIPVKNCSSIKIGVQNERNNDTEFVLQNVLKAKSINDFNNFIIAYNVVNKEVKRFENTTFNFNGEHLINGEKELKKRVVSPEEKESILDYIIENKSFPHFIKSKKFQKIKLNTSSNNQKASNIIQL